ncbi:MAG: FAD binding domain-containing protein [Firmicutes bacterium]|nr:FAD binding domain-containing protein [Bacillota bacterium]
MKPPRFDYLQPETVDEAVAALAEYGSEAKILAGGQSLIPLLNMRLATPAALVDLNRVQGLAGIEATPSGLVTGSLVRQAALLAWAKAQPAWRVLAEAISHIGHPQTRNAGTVGGSLVHADPSAELPLLFVTLGGRAEVEGPSGRRAVEAQDFFQFLFTTALSPQEVLTAIHWHALPPRGGAAFAEFSRRRGDFAVVAAAAVVRVDEEHRISGARLGFSGMGPVPQLVEIEPYLAGGAWSAEGAASALAELVAGLDPPGDLAASPEQRRRLARVLGADVLARAYQRAVAVSDSDREGR